MWRFIVPEGHNVSGVIFAVLQSLAIITVQSRVVGQSTPIPKFLIRTCQELFPVEHDAQPLDGRVLQHDQALAEL